MSDQVACAYCGCKPHPLQREPCATCSSWTCTGRCADRHAAEEHNGFTAHEAEHATAGIASIDQEED